MTDHIKGTPYDLTVNLTLFAQKLRALRETIVVSSNQEASAALIQAARTIDDLRAQFRLIGVDGGMIEKCVLYSDCCKAVSFDVAGCSSELSLCTPADCANAILWIEEKTLAVANACTSYYPN